MKIKHSLLSIASLFVTVGVSYLVFPHMTTLMVLAVLIMHEFGHYIMGWASGGDAYMPLFIPFIIFTVGITRIKNLKEEFKPIVAIAGPLLGSAVALALMFLALAIGESVIALFMLGTLGFELFAATVGSDGKRFRKTRKANDFRSDDSSGDSLGNLAVA